MERFETPPIAAALCLAVLVIVAAALSWLDLVPASLARQLAVTSTLAGVGFALVWRFWLADVEGV